jgi:ATP sulfurylase
VNTKQELVETLVRELAIPNQDQVNQKLELLRHYLHRIQVRKVKMGDFQPSKRTIESSDIDQVVEEFRNFLSGHMNSESKDEFTIVEIE